MSTFCSTMVLTDAQKMQNARLTHGSEFFYRVAHSEVSLTAKESPEFVMPDCEDASEAELENLAETLCASVKRFQGAVSTGDDDFGSVSDFAVSTADLKADVVAFALDKKFQGMSQCDLGSATLLCRIGKGAPFELLSLGGGENSGYPSEANAAAFKRLTKKLGLKHASPAEVLAVIIAVADPGGLLAAPLLRVRNSETEFYSYSEDYFGPSYGDDDMSFAGKVPIFGEAMPLINYLVPGSDSSDDEEGDEDED